MAIPRLLQRRALRVKLVIFLAIASIVACVYFVFAAIQPSVQHASPSTLSTVRTTSSSLEDTTDETTLEHIVFAIHGGQISHSNVDFLRTSQWLQIIPHWVLVSDEVLAGAQTIVIRTASYLHRTFVLIPELLRQAPAHARWFVIADMDTIMFPRNLVAMLRSHNHRRRWYIGNTSDSLKARLFHGDFAYGGAGTIVSRATLELAAQHYTYCYDKFSNIYAGDEIWGLCLAELGVSMTYNYGMHQMDISGDLRGFLEGTVSANVPVISMHHMYTAQPIFPSEPTSHAALARLWNIAQTSADAEATLFTRDIIHGLVIDTPHRHYSVKWTRGYSLHIYQAGGFDFGQLVQEEDTTGTWFMARRTVKPLHVPVTRYYRDPQLGEHGYRLQTVGAGEQAMTAPPAVANVMCGDADRASVVDGRVEVTIFC